MQNGIEVKNLENGDVSIVLSMEKVVFLEHLLAKIVPISKVMGKQGVYSERQAFWELQQIAGGVYNRDSEL